MFLKAVISLSIEAPGHISWSALSVSSHNKVGHHKHLLEPEANKRNMYADRLIVALRILKQSPFSS